ncbi:MAG TPA: UMP kinase [Thermoplasmata archaeon]|nr:UMP kinase [Thermoplasmata archaeon]
MSPPSAARPTPVVVSIGGSVLLTGDDDTEYLGRLARSLGRLGRRMPLVVTTGGGRTARDYIRLGRALGLTEVELDEIGIQVTRLHAHLLAARIGAPAPSHPPETVRAAVAALATGSPVVLGGTEPGHTTDGVASLIAVRLRAARVVNATDVDGVYDRDPRTDPAARLRPHLRWRELQRLVADASTGTAGQHLPFDRLGTELLARAKIPLRVVDGRDLPNLERAVVGRPFSGTEVVP